MKHVSEFWDLVRLAQTGISWQVWRRRRTTKEIPATAAIHFVRDLGSRRIDFHCSDYHLSQIAEANTRSFYGIQIAISDLLLYFTHYMRS